MRTPAIFWLCLALGFSLARAELLYQLAPLASPAGEGSLGPSLSKAPDGGVWLSWLQPAGDGRTELRFSTLDLPGKKWREPQTIAAGADWAVKPSDFPTLTVGPDGRVTAVWFVQNPTVAAAPAAHAHAAHGPSYHAVFSLSADAGKTWTPPTRLTRESDAVEFVSLVTLADGRVLAAWLDGRAKTSGSDKQQLFARIVGSTGADTLVDASVCDCCPTSLTAFPDGSALLGYRGRGDGEIRDILVARYLDGTWESARPSTGENWKIAGCPVNGPRLVSDGPRVLKVWFTASADEPRIMVATSDNAGGLYTAAQRADLGSTIGRVDALLLRDGSQLVSWLAPGTAAAGSKGGFYLRRYNPGGGTQPPALLAALTDARTAGFPRIVLAKDFDATPAQLIAAFTHDGGQLGVETLLVTMPSAELLAEADLNCGCATPGETPQGYAIRGEVVALSPTSGVVRLRHPAVPGLMRAGETEFTAGPDVLSAVKVGQEVLARAEPKTGGWRLFDVRVLVR